MRHSERARAKILVADEEAADLLHQLEDDSTLRRMSWQQVSMSRGMIIEQLQSCTSIIDTLYDALVEIESQRVEKVRNQDNAALAFGGGFILPTAVQSRASYLLLCSICSQLRRVLREAHRLIVSIAHVLPQDADVIIHKEADVSVVTEERSEDRVFDLARIAVHPLTCVNHRAFSCAPLLAA